MRFSGTNIDPSLFDFMTDEMIKELIPQMDLRLTFKRKYEEFKSKMSQLVNSTRQLASPESMEPKSASSMQEIQSTSAQSTDEFMELEDTLFIDPKDIDKMPQEAEVPGPALQDRHDGIINFVELPDKMNFQSCSDFQIEEGTSTIHQPNS